MYDTKTGRFLSEDPLGYAAGDANLYRYVLNSPVNYIDPTGQAAVLAQAPIAPPPPAPAPVPPTIPAPAPPPGPLGGAGLAGLGQLGAAALAAVLWVLLDARPVNVGEDEFLDPNICTALDPPWPQRHSWPRNCQIEYQIPIPDSGFDRCIYACRDAGRSFQIFTRIPVGSKCPKWFDWVPKPVINPNNLPPDAIP